MGEQSMRVLVFSHKAEVREAIVNAVGRRPAADLGRVDYVEASGIADVACAGENLLSLVRMSR